MHLRLRLLAILLLASLITSTSLWGRTVATAAPSLSVQLASRRVAPLQQRVPLPSLVTAPIPARNLFQLADQLKLRPPRSIARVIRSTSPNYPVGHQDTFYVLSEDSNRYFTMHATIEGETPHLYIYVQNGLHLSRAQVQTAAELFEKHTYPTDRAHFGSEWRPGVDGDPHITCLVGNLRSAGAGGFYSAEDEYPRLVNPYSNQREMIYINSGAAVPGDPIFNEYLAHEFQHMIHWHMHPHDNAWLNEGMSMLAEGINGYTPEDEMSAYLQLPNTQLDAWSLNGLSSFAHYGAAYFFLSYLYDRFGTGFIRDMLADGKYTDFALIDHVLEQRHIKATADGLFRQWVVANALRNASVDKGVYFYPQMKGTLAMKKERAVRFATRARVVPYAAQYYALDGLSGQKTFQIAFTAPATVPLVHLTGAGPFWWSNRGDMSDTTLQRVVDLRHVHAASLHFRTDYDIETNYDYAYVEASVDGGRTWTTLPGTDTTRSNPNGANYGNAYTGRSKRERVETVNLSRYAGHKILLRFQYVTDDEYTGEGIVIKDIAIPAIGFYDNFTGWQVHGFVPVVRNVLPSTWHVQVISYGRGGPRVSELKLSNGSGSLTVDPAKTGLEKMVLVVFNAAAKTTVASTYRLSARLAPGS